MPSIELTTTIRAPIERCFDLARSIDFHVITMGQTGEHAVDGRTSGLIGLDETVTWRGRHLGVWQELTVRITACDPPRHFQDVMVTGAFASMEHDHHFATDGEATTMTDRFAYRSPLGLLGVLADRLFLQRYLRQLLLERARILKAAAESDGWQTFLHPAHGPGRER